MNISSLLTLPYPFNSLIYTKDIMIIALLLQMMGDGKVGGVSFMLGFEWEDRVPIIFFLFFVLFLCSCQFFFHDSCSVCFIIPSLLSLSSFNQALLVHRNCSASVLSVPLWALGSKSTSLSSGFLFVSRGCMIRLVFCCDLSPWS